MEVGAQPNMKSKQLENARFQKIQHGARESVRETSHRHAPATRRYHDTNTLYMQTSVETNG